MMQEIVRKAIKLAQEALKDEKAHGFDHVMRVYKNAMKIAKAYNGRIDGEVVALAAILHDIGRKSERKDVHHALISAKMAEEFLLNENFPKDKIEKVKEAIIAHSYSLGVKPTSLEAMIISDADKLDAIGAIGIARCFIESGVRGRNIGESIVHFIEKLLKLKDLMFTDEAKRIAKRRHEFMIRFLEELRDEMMGVA
ncbi:MAG: phosphohydrolase [Thermoprotei archaeon]|nr:MAG: phosphohydrolase [Thermoprotei archaeon]